jgi:hypothetical protein
MAVAQPSRCVGSAVPVSDNRGRRSQFACAGEPRLPDQSWPLRDCIATVHTTASRAVRFVRLRDDEGDGCGLPLAGDGSVGPGPAASNMTT